MRPCCPAPLLALTAIACITVVAPFAAQEPDARSRTVPFSDPSRPGTVHVTVMRGDILVRGRDRRDVLVSMRDGRDDNARAERAKRAERERANDRADDRAAGLKRLTQPDGLTIEERQNEISIGAGFMRGGDVEIEVPARTNLRLHGMLGDIVVENVEGEIETNSTNGAVRLTNVGGAVLAQTMNGGVTATFSRLAANKAMSFASFNGHVDVTLPADARANVKLTSTRGDVYTDFDVQVSRSAAAAQTSSRNGRNTFDIDRAIVGTLNGGGPEMELRTFNGNLYLRRAR